MSANEHVSNALDWQHGDAEPSTFALRNAQIEATLALAYEQRTANLIALWANPETTLMDLKTGRQRTCGVGTEVMDKVLREILERLVGESDGTAK